MNQAQSICFCVQPQCTRRPLCLTNIGEVMQHSSQGHVIFGIDSIYNIINRFRQGQDQMDMRTNKLQKFINKLEEMKKEIVSKIDLQIQEIKSNLLEKRSTQDKVLELIIDYQSRNISIETMNELINPIMSLKDDLSFLQEKNLIEYLKNQDQSDPDFSQGNTLRNQLLSIYEVLGLEYPQADEQMTKEKKLELSQDQLDLIPHIQDKQLYTDIQVDLRGKSLSSANYLNNLQIFKGLKRLIINLRENQITDISFMKGICTLKQLKVLSINIWDNKLIDITPLINLESLTKLSKLRLEFQYNKIVDLTPLCQLPGTLETLSIGFYDNPIEDISILNILGKMNKLRSLLIDLPQTKMYQMEVLEILGQLKELRVLGLWITQYQLQKISHISVLNECQLLELVKLEIRYSKANGKDLESQFRHREQKKKAIKNQK